MDFKLWSAEYRGLCQRASTASAGVRESEEVLEKRRAAAQELHRELGAHRAELAVVRAQVEGVRRGVKTELDLTRFDEALRGFRSRMRLEYDELRGAEVQLSREVEASRLRFEGWTSSREESRPSQNEARSSSSGQEVFERLRRKPGVAAGESSEATRATTRPETTRLEKRIAKRGDRAEAKREAARERDAREATKAAAKAWRFLRDRDRDRETAEAARLEDREKRRQAERRAARLADDRAKLQAYRQQRRSQNQTAPVAPAPKPAKADLDYNAKRAIETARDRWHRTRAKSTKRDREDLRLKRIADALVPRAAPDAARLRRPTSASKFREFAADDLDDAQLDRDCTVAHARPVFGGAYDLKYVGRAIPAWRAPLA